MISTISEIRLSLEESKFEDNEQLSSAAPTTQVAALSP
jgi:hypothetical protein